MNGDSTTSAVIERIQTSALSVARVDDDPAALAFAGALEPARRGTTDSDRSPFTTLTAAIVADRLANHDSSGNQFGPTAARAAANPLPVTADATPLGLGAALLVACTEATADDAATLAGISITAVERRLDDLD